MKNFSFKNIILKIHLWIGLFAGTIVFIICVTGCIYTFQKEIKLAIYPYYSVKNNENEKLPLQNLLKLYEKQSENKIVQIYDFTETDRSTILKTSYKDEFFYSFINPYTGKLLKEKALSDDFFTIVLRIHRNLLLEKEFGRQIIGWVVIIFAISLITGIIMWVPKNKKIFKSKKVRKSKFTVKRTSKIKRMIFDLHSVLGFYSSFILIISAVTGLGWTFSWVDESLYRMVTFEIKEQEKPLVIDSSTLAYSSLDIVKAKMDYNQENRHLFVYVFPEKTTQPLKIIVYPNEASYGSSDYFYASPATGKILKTDLDIDKKRGTKFRSLYYDIHTGSILGIWGKILVFIAGLIGASLPITGFILWLNKRKKRLSKLEKQVRQ
jgi:uncharacterized iron-regulated membrane protein